MERKKGRRFISGDLDRGFFPACFPFLQRCRPCEQISLTFEARQGSSRPFPEGLSLPVFEKVEKFVEKGESLPSFRQFSVDEDACPSSLHDVEPPCFTGKKRILQVNLFSRPLLGPDEKRELVEPRPFGGGCSGPLRNIFRWFGKKEGRCCIHEIIRRRRPPCPLLPSVKLPRQ